ncbi:hypothetical protein KC669_03775 [Candidatus Dojkabacteria bacterium]|uniref:Uncharacterized protein n=1 Tax=Candidatus Dojkabacteria bacterium TaxID=2099670 RepID=A0A955LBS0_9BACT|nr:hypothetical protein [Candidatus Dojkabacteria bacterium]
MESCPEDIYSNHLATFISLLVQQKHPDQLNNELQVIISKCTETNTPHEIVDDIRNIISEIRKDDPNLGNLTHQHFEALISNQVQD